MVASYCKPLYRADKRLLGIISTDLSLLRLSKIITTETSFADSYFFMIGDEGRYYLHPDSTQLFTKTIFSDADPDKNADIIALGHQMTTGQQGSMSVMIKGQPCIVSYQPVPGTNWSLALVCPERSILKNYNLLAYILSPLIIIGLLLILFFSSFVVTHAIRPLNNLAYSCSALPMVITTSQIAIRATAMSWAVCRTVSPPCRNRWTIMSATSSR